MDCDVRTGWRRPERRSSSLCPAALAAEAVLDQQRPGPAGLHPYAESFDPRVPDEEVYLVCLGGLDHALGTFLRCMARSRFGFALSKAAPSERASEAD